MGRIRNHLKISGRRKTRYVLYEADLAFHASVSGPANMCSKGLDFWQGYESAKWRSHEGGDVFELYFLDEDVVVAWIESGRRWRKRLCGWPFSVMRPNQRCDLIELMRHRWECSGSGSGDVLRAGLGPLEVCPNLAESDLDSFNGLGGLEDACDSDCGVVFVPGLSVRPYVGTSPGMYRVGSCDPVGQLGNLTPVL